MPGLPAKDIIDVDLTLRDVVDEDKYVEPLESAGFLFLLRYVYRKQPWLSCSAFAPSRLEQQNLMHCRTMADFCDHCSEPYWHQHRFFAENWPGSLGYHVNLHVCTYDLVPIFCPNPRYSGPIVQIFTQSNKS